MKSVPHHRSLSVDIGFQYCQPCQRAVYLVEVASDESLHQINQILVDLSPRVRSVLLSTGRIHSFAVSLLNEDSLLLDEIDGFLKTHFVFVALHRSTNQCIFRVIETLCAESASTLLPIDTCDICDKPEPFPELIVQITSRNGKPIGEYKLCTHCTAEISELKGLAILRHLQDAMSLHHKCALELPEVLSPKDHHSPRFRATSHPCTS